MSNGSGQRPVPGGLEQYWNGPVRDFATVDIPAMTPGQQERHRMYSLCLMALMSHYWSGNKYGETGDYGVWRTSCAWAQYAPPSVREPLGPELTLEDGNFVRPDLLNEDSEYRSRCVGVHP